MWLQRKPLEIDFARLATFHLAAGKGRASAVSLRAADFTGYLGPEEAAVGALISLRSMGDWFINSLAENLASGRQANLVDLQVWWGKPYPGLVERYQTLPERFGEEPLDLSQGVGQRLAEVVPPINNLVAHFSNAWQYPSPPTANAGPGEPYRPPLREVSLAFASEAAIALVDASFEVARRVRRAVPDDFSMLRKVAEVPSSDGGRRPEPPSFSRKARDIR